MIVCLDSRHPNLANGKIWLYATHDDHVIGQISIEDKGNEWAWINDLFVAAPFRRCGWATKLVSGAMDRAHLIAAGKEGTRGAACGIGSDNAASIALFERLGFSWCFTYPDSPVRLYSIVTQ